jgi:hypothetical protein
MIAVLPGSFLLSVAASFSASANPSSRHSFKALSKTTAVGSVEAFTPQEQRSKSEDGVNGWNGGNAGMGIAVTAETNVVVLFGAVTLRWSSAYLRRQEFFRLSIRNAAAN